MNALVLLPLEDSMAQCGAGKQDPWRGYMTILVVNERNLKSINILTVVMHPMIKFNVDTAGDCVRQDVMRTLAMR